MPCFARVFGVIVISSKFTDCGKSEQDGASCYYLLVVKIGSKKEKVTTKKLGTFLYQVFYMISSFSSILKLSKYNSWFFFISANF